MVRHKSRWLLIRIDREEHVKCLQDAQAAHKNRPRTTSTVFEKKFIFHELRKTIERAFGIARAGVADDIQGKLR